jgi:hypothetical protein
MFYTQSGFLSDQNSSNLIPAARDYRLTAGLGYDKALTQYEMTLNEYRGLSRTSATSSIENLMADTYTTLKMVSLALQNTQNTITYVVRSQPEYQASLANTAASSVITWSNQVNSDLASIVSAQNTIVSSKNSLDTLLTGAEDLDIQSQRLSLQQAEQNYAKYFIRAPFDGVVGRIPVSLYGQASGSTVIATISSNRKITTIPLNEVDAVKVQKGDRVKLTFDALSDLTIDAEVIDVDLVGTASQGVVTYNVKIAFEGTDPRVRAGMSVDSSIITKEKSGVLVVPSSAVKSQGQRKYVEVIDDQSAIDSATATVSRSTNSGQNNVAATFNRTIRFSSTTRGQMASSTLKNPGTSSMTNGTRQNQVVTVSTKTAPRQVTVVVGDSDDTNTEIISGLEEGQRVVTRTIMGGSTTASTQAPSIFNSFGGQQRGTGGAVRAISR